MFDPKGGGDIRERRNTRKRVNSLDDIEQIRARHCEMGTKVGVQLVPRFLHLCLEDIHK